VTQDGEPDGIEPLHRAPPSQPLRRQGTTAYLLLECLQTKWYRRQLTFAFGRKPRKRALTQGAKCKPPRKIKQCGCYQDFAQAQPLERLQILTELARLSPYTVVF